MATRRAFLGGLLTVAIVPKSTWADVGDPHYLAAAKLDDGSYRLFGLGIAGNIAFSVPLPTRGHAAAAHPTRPEAVAFARRPGTYAIAIDCHSGRIIRQLNTPGGRHFYGHGIFSADGSVLYTTENDFELGVGRIGMWDTKEGYTRIGEFASGGIGPHDILRHPGKDTLIIANGGIDTHPDTGRAKLNLPTMAPNITYTDQNGTILEQVSLAPELHLNSIRHLSIRNDGLLAFAMQTQGDQTKPQPLLGTHRVGDIPKLLSPPAMQLKAMQGYGASVAFSDNGSRIAITSSRGGQVQIFDADSMAYVSAYIAADVSGLGATQNGFLVTAGTGEIVSLEGTQVVRRAQHRHNWDNHLIRISGDNSP